MRPFRFLGPIGDGTGGATTSGGAAGSSGGSAGAGGNCGPGQEGLAISLANALYEYQSDNDTHHDCGE